MRCLQSAGWWCGRDPWRCSTGASQTLQTTGLEPDPSQASPSYLPPSSADCTQAVHTCNSLFVFVTLSFLTNLCFISFQLCCKLASLDQRQLLKNLICGKKTDTDTETDKETDTQSDRHNHTERDRYKHRHAHTHIQTDTLNWQEKRNTDWTTNTNKTMRETDRQTDRQTQREQTLASDSWIAFGLMLTGLESCTTSLRGLLPASRRDLDTDTHQIVQTTSTSHHQRNIPSENLQLY